MRRSLHLVSICAVLFLSLAGCGSERKEAERPEAVPQYTVQDFLANIAYRGASFSPDNSKVLVSSNESGVFNAYSIPVDGGTPEQLTSSTDNSVFVLGYFPEDERFLYTSDQGGDELNHIYVREPDGTVTDLTPGRGHKAVFYGWAWDDESFYVGSNERDRRFFDIYEYALDGYDRTMVFENDEGYEFACASPDRKYIALSKTLTSTDSDIYLYDTESKEITLITEHEGEIVHSPQTFSPDGAGLYYLTDEGSEFLYLAKYDLRSGAKEKVLEEDWDLLYAYLSKRGRYMVVGVNEDARTELRVYEPSTMKSVRLPELPDAEISSVTLSRDEAHMCFYASSGRMPSDLFYYRMSGGRARQLTRSLNPKIRPEHLVEGRVVRFESFDGLEIPGILYKPHQASEREKIPALVYVHGGPGGQSRVGYSALIQYLVNHGYAVFAINNRGSSGYGKTFFRMDDRKHGEGDLDDCVWSKKMLAGTGYVDPERIGILGGSYGGYMVLAALAFRPQEFAAGVDIFGVSNWVRTLRSIPPWWESFRRALEVEMGDFDDEEYLRSISPLFHAGNIVKPLIVLQGANDPRVLKVESDEIVEKVRANGVPVEYIVFQDEGHGFLKTRNRERGYEAILRFLDEHLGGVGSAAAQPDSVLVERFARLALDCVHREYPNKISHVLLSDDDVAPPRDLTPAFCGCFDWHSSVHGHWMLARLARLYPDAAFVPEARAALEVSLTPENIAAEAAYLAGEKRESFERPYGLAWLLCLAQELREWDDEDARRWAANLEPLESAAWNRIAAWLPKLYYPIRTGEHSQTAFAFGLILDWAETSGDLEKIELLRSTVLRLYLEDRDCPLGYEPSGQDFLSPCLAEADLMRRVLPPREFAEWLSGFLPGIPEGAGAGWLPVAVVTDRADGKLAHLDGLNLSRAWMLEGIIAGLPEDDPLIPALRAAASAHRDAGLAAVTGEHYEGGHWLGSFATYLVTEKGK